MARKGTKTAKATDAPAGRRAYRKPSSVDAAVKRIADKISGDGNSASRFTARGGTAPTRPAAADTDILRLEGNRNLELERLLEDRAGDTDGRDKGKKKSRIRFENDMEGEDAVACLKSIIAGLTGGSLRIRNGDASVALSPVSPFRITVKASRKKKDECVKLEIRWRRRTGETLDITFR